MSRKPAIDLLASTQGNAASPPCRDGKNITEISAPLSTVRTTVANIVPVAKLKLSLARIEFTVELKRRPRHDVRATAAYCTLWNLGTF
ncbi:MAG: hypothetical protein M3Z96_04315 [Pseudomonadota bacterium]|nr:hypothetical protein [Pseudomonadota bacterium]